MVFVSRVLCPVVIFLAHVKTHRTLIDADSQIEPSLRYFVVVAVELGACV